ncbi:MAG: pyridoxal-dependent decarboxylase, partial [Thermodesulfobacteriota bacterium]|nr:pyridoxal-dependent decarboxylase [Thermodesulfobacteriota bacterium]
SQYIIRKNSVDTGRFTVEGSRPFSCLKPWAALKILGREGYGFLFRRAQASTKTFKKILEECGNFEILNNPELFILNYRFIPENVRQQLVKMWPIASPPKDKIKARVAEGQIRKINHLVNAFNIKLHKALRTDDTTFVSRTTLESTPYRPQNIVVLRAVLVNPLIDRQILEEIVDTQNRIGLQMWEEFESAYRRIPEGPG